MRYACLVYIDRSKLQAWTDEEWRRLRRESSACEDELRRGGYLVAAEVLSCEGTATTLRVREGRQHTIDGPAVTTREELGGVLMLEARDLNEAIRLAARHPAARLGGIEIRPVAAGRTGPPGNAVPEPV
mgnify:CR=1 FL=1